MDYFVGLNRLGFDIVSALASDWTADVSTIRAHFTKTRSDSLTPDLHELLDEMLPPRSLNHEGAAHCITYSHGLAFKSVEIRLRGYGSLFSSHLAGKLQSRHVQPRTEGKIS
jgi:hypothetical protein